MELAATTVVDTERLEIAALFTEANAVTKELLLIELEADLFTIPNELKAVAASKVAIAFFPTAAKDVKLASEFAELCPCRTLFALKATELVDKIPQTPRLISVPA